LLLSTLFFGLSSFFRKLAVDRIHPYQLQIVAGAVYALEVPVWLYLLRSANISGYDATGVGYAFLTIVVYVLGAVCFSTLLKGTHDIGAMTTMASMSPVITTLLSVALLGESFTVKKAIATAVMLVGLALFNL